MREEVTERLVTVLVVRVLVDVREVLDCVPEVLVLLVRVRVDVTEVLDCVDVIDVEVMLVLEVIVVRV